MKAKVYETKDIHANQDLVTRYYICNYDNAIEAIKTVLKDYGYFLAGENNDYHELLFVGKNFDVIVRVSTYNPRETGIDFFVDKKSLFSGNPTKHIAAWYTAIGNKVQFKGTGLHKNG